MAAPPIISAARGADVETLRRLLAEGVSPDEITWGFGRTPLHWLCNPDTFNPVISVSPSKVSDLVTCFKLLREAGANLEAVDGWGYTPLQCAAYSAFPELLSLLVQARVNLDARSNVGTTALHRAARVSDGRANDCVDVLLAGGASVNARDSSGETPFDVALSHHCRRMWPLFLRAGAEIPTNNTDPYIVRVRNAGGFKKYEQAHLSRITSILAPTPLLPPELVRKVLEFWLHAGYY
jgi:ankyrin repeat protein